jgi:hypothetical protein
MLPHIVENRAFEEVVFDFLLQMEKQGVTVGVIQALKKCRPENTAFLSVCDEVLPGFATDRTRVVEVRNNERDHGDPAVVKEEATIQPPPAT